MDWLWLIIVLVLVVWLWFFVVAKIVLLSLRAEWKKKQGRDLQFVLVKIPHSGTSRQWDIAADDNIQSMKQNMEVMNQIYKNFGALIDDTWKSRWFGPEYISMELIVENELIKFVLWVPLRYKLTIEQLIGSFYPGAVIESITMPKLLEAWKYMAWWWFELDKKDVFPLKNYESFEADPMDSILSACSRLTRDEKMGLQLLVTPLEGKPYKKFVSYAEKVKDGKSGWKFSLGGIWNFFVSWKTDDDKPADKKSWLHGQRTWAIEQKVEEELFSVSMRAFVTSPVEKRPKRILTDLSKTLTQFSYIGSNSLSLTQTTKRVVDFSKIFIRRSMQWFWWWRQRFWYGEKSMVLSIKELSSLYHFPHRRFNRNPRIKWQKFKIVPAPDNIPTEWIYLGENVYGGIRKKIYLKPVDRFRHFYTIGQTGTGKSTAMLTMAMQDLQNGNGFCLIDPHGDLCEHLLHHLPKERIDDLIYFDFANVDYPIGFNVFEAENDDERDIITNDIVEMFVGMYGQEIFGPRIQDYFRNASFLLMEQPEWGTFPEIMRLFTDDAFLESKLKHLKNPVIASWWNKTYRSMGDREKKEIIPFLQAKFGPFTTWVYVRNVIGQPKSGFNFWDAMQSNKIILCNLSKWLTGEINSQLIGRMFSIQIKLAALKRASIKEEERVPFFLYVDEFQNYVSQSFESILSEARKYRLGLIIAHQYIEQLKSAWLWGSIDLSKPIFGNVGSMLCLKVWPEDAEFLEKNFEPEFTKTDLVNMDRFMWVTRLSIDTQPSQPFTLQNANPYAIEHLNNDQKVDVIKQISALKWGTKRELVEKEVYYRVWV